MKMTLFIVILTYEDDLVEPFTEVFGDHFKADILYSCAW